MHSLMTRLEDEVASRVAARVRAARTRQRWTLDELAGRSGVSRRLLVAIEQANANPSLSTLLKLASALGISLAALVEDQPDEGPVRVVGHEQAQTLWSTERGSFARLLVGHGPLELWAFTLAAGDRRDGPPHRAGSLELLTVDAGALTLEVADSRVEVVAGDCAWFDATRPHAYRNQTADRVRFTLAVLEPGSGAPAP